MLGEAEKSQAELPWGWSCRRKAPRRRSARHAIKIALDELREAEREGAPQETLREKYWALEAAMATEGARDSQLELDLYDGVRLDRMDRLRRLGKDPHPERAFEDSSEAIQGFAELFPEGMTFTEIAWCLGLAHKQHAHKIFQRAVAKMLRSFGRSADQIRETLRERDAMASGWDAVLESM